MRQQDQLGMQSCKGFLCWRPRAHLPRCRRAGRAANRQALPCRGCQVTLSTPSHLQRQVPGLQQCAAAHAKNKGADKRLHEDVAGLAKGGKR